MSIEFRCTQCNKLLRTDDNTVGKQAKCPACGTVMVIPAASIAEFPSSPGGSSRSGTPCLTSPGLTDVRHGVPDLPYTGAGEIRPTLIDLSEIFSTTWSIFKKQWGMCLLTIILIGIINFLCSLSVTFSTNIISSITRDKTAVFIVLVLGRLFLILLTTWLSIGQALLFLKIARGREANFGDLLTGGPFILLVIGASIIYSLIVLVGLVLFIVPGIILALMFSQYYFLIIDRKVGIGDAFALSKQVTTGNKLTLFLIWLLSMVITILAIIPCGLGLIVAIPYFNLMLPVIYLRITGQQTGG